ncbi:MAG: hypothetical protein EZS28_015440 [Streblomastix strix]|uniref:Uncharacterized protein n=1 Tax=Streblomastix strix TaxID=222440 RepID=A0A5J4W226_9EUKA|nr:MAG: hypothetical protein EZS28_015440 [Streblomastix strix]
MHMVLHVLQTFRSYNNRHRQDCFVPKCHILLRFEVPEVSIQSNIVMNLKNIVVVCNRQNLSAPENVNLPYPLVPLKLTARLSLKSSSYSLYLLISTGNGMSDDEEDQIQDRIVASPSPLPH